MERFYLINTFLHIYFVIFLRRKYCKQKIRENVELNVSVHSFFCHPTESFTRSQDCMTERKPIVIQIQKQKFCILFTNRTFVFPLNLNWSTFSIKGCSHDSSITRRARIEKHGPSSLATSVTFGKRTKTYEELFIQK